jgi:hypothetical protein
MPRRIAPIGKRKPIAARSKLSTSELAAREACREAVLRRDRNCQAFYLHLLWPSGKAVACQGLSSQVHELKRGKMRRDCYLDPARCIGLCAPCHQWVTENPKAAIELGLALNSWDPWP